MIYVSSLEFQAGSCLYVTAAVKGGSLRARCTWSQRPKLVQGSVEPVGALVSQLILLLSPCSLLQLASTPWMASRSSSTWFVDSRCLPSSHPLRHSQPLLHGLRHLTAYSATNSRSGFCYSASDSGHPQRSALCQRTSHYFWDDAHRELRQHSG